MVKWEVIIPVFIGPYGKKEMKLLLKARKNFFMKLGERSKNKKLVRVLPSEP